MREIRKSNKQSALVLGITLAWFACFAGNARATTQTLTVTTTADSNDGSCTGTTCSLRDAITQANKDTADTITFASGVTGTITLESALPQVTANLTIQGPGANVLTISGAGKYQILSVNAPAFLGISGLTLTNANGGAISGKGGLDVQNCAFSGNSGGNGVIAVFSNGPPPAPAAIISVRGSTFSNNSATAIVTFDATVFVVNSTFSHNQEPDISITVVNQPNVSVSVTNSTFFENRFGGISSQVYSGSTGQITLQVSNSLFFHSGISGAWSGSNNLGLSFPSADPLLLPLGYYGGPTQTMLPQPGSPAICAGTSRIAEVELPPTDQRGFPLSTANCSNGGVDVGAVQTNYLMVNTTADSNDGACTSTTCSLRDAITAANTATMADIGFTSTLAGQTITLGSLLPAVRGQVNIIGLLNNPSGGVAISGANTYRIFSINARSVFLDGLTIQNGSSDAGGALVNEEGTLTVTNSTFSGNSAPSGGAIVNDVGKLTVTNSTFSGNSAPNGVGGAIYNDTGTLTVTNSTFSSNSANLGATISNDSGILTATNSVFSGNSAQQQGQTGGIYNSGSVTESYNLFFNNTGGDASGVPEFPGTGDVIGQDPRLAPLGNYGGPTQTFLPLPGSSTQSGSAAICAGSASLIPAGITTDQRGFPRTTAYTVNGSPTTCVDIGAVQTNYAVQFTNATNGYSAFVGLAVTPPPPIVSVTENGQNIGGVPITLTFNGSGTATGLGPVTTAAGTATFSTLTVDTAGTDTLSATLNLNPTTATPVLSISTGNATLTVTKQNQTITFDTPGTQLQGTTLPLSASATSGLAVTFQSKTIGVCTVSGTTATFISYGTCTIEADQSGNNTYAAAQAVTDSFAVNPIYVLAASPVKGSKTAPGTAPINLQVEQPGHGFTGAVVLSCAVTPLPAPGWKCPGLPTTVTLGSKAVTIATGVLFPSGTTTGAYTVVFTGTATSSSHVQTTSTASATINVTGP